jgi:hypothetical protein
MLFKLALNFSFHVKADEVKAMHDIPTVDNVQIPPLNTSQFEDYFFTTFLCTR